MIIIAGLFTLKMKYDESDNLMIRASRVVTDKFADIFSKFWFSLFSPICIFPLLSDTFFNSLDCGLAVADT